jgi:hypothetical protein
VLLLTGIGGIGKTSLANIATREVIQQFHFQEVIWLRASATAGEGSDLPIHLTPDSLLLHLGQQLCPHLPPTTPPRQQRAQLRQILKASPHLIILDNLEMELPADLLLLLADLAAPSKFLLTARTQPTPQAGILNVPLPTLSLADVIRLVRYYAAEIELKEMSQATDEEIAAIYEEVGGNPLALKLVVNLAGVLPLSAVLHDLTRAQLGEVEALYRHIYWHTWHSLSDEGRALLKVMPLVSDSGGTPEQMLAMSELDERLFWTAVTELVRRCLLEVRGSAQARRYGLHRLTESFLKTEIIHWPVGN